MKKRVCIITGGNRGIGESITREFWSNGYYVVIGARTDTGIASELGERARFHRMDVRNEKDHLAMVDATYQWTGRLDVFINNAGFSEWRNLDAIDESFWNRMIDTNLKGVFYGCKTAAKAFTDGGSIINISSLAGKRGSANNSVYCASKFGVNGITQALAKELGPRAIRVNAVCPVYVKTQGVIDALESKVSPASGEKISKYLSEFANTNAALKRLPTGVEVARLCLFLASDAASAITGQCINIDCGVLPQ